MILSMNLGEHSYDIVLARGILRKAGAYLKLERKILIVTDDGVPEEYANIVAAQCKHPVKISVKAGEESKSFATFEKLCRTMLEKGFTRTDAVVAVGGGVVGDLAGFAAASFMRGIDFYNIPTTLLSQVDSSIGGKTAINLGGVKNIIGAFHQPKKVLIDPDVLKTLPARQIANGLAEAIKMAATFDKEFFSFLENNDIQDNLDTIIERSLRIKKYVVEHDEKEAGLRRVLNFGHTIGHGIEACSNYDISHGAAVGMGIAIVSRAACTIGICTEEAKNKIQKLLEIFCLCTGTEFTADALFNCALSDKKRSGSCVNLIVPRRIGECMILPTPVEDLKSFIEAGLK